MSETNLNRLLQQTRQQKARNNRTAEQYARYLERAVTAISTSTSSDTQLVGKMTQIHSDRDKISHQQKTMLNLETRCHARAEELRKQLERSKRHLVKNSVLRYKDDITDNVMQRRTELLDQKIRTIENCVKLVEEENVVGTSQNASRTAFAME